MTEEEYLLGKLAEEAAEVAQEALKTQYFGFDCVNPKTGETNWQALERELQDLMIILGMLNESSGFSVDLEKLAERKASKQEKVMKYYGLHKEIKGKQ